jgi:hypothetical protein
MWEKEKEENGRENISKASIAKNRRGSHNANIANIVVRKKQILNNILHQNKGYTFILH